MKVLLIDNYAIKSLKRYENAVFLIEGINHNMILIYNYNTKQFFLTPASCQEKNKDNIETKINSKVSLINKLSIKLDRTANLWQFQLGKARYYISFLEDEDRALYLEQAKLALLHVNERHPDNTKAFIEGYAEFDDDIFTFTNNLSKIDRNKYLKTKLEQLEIPLDNYNKTI